MPSNIEQPEVNHYGQPEPPSGPAALVAGVWRWAARQLDQRRHARQAADLDDHVLRDIGLPRTAVWGGSGPRRDPTHNS